MSKTKEQVDEKFSLEKNFEMLENLLEQLSSEDISLEDAFTTYSKGMDLLRQCNDQIDRVEKKVMLLNEEGGFEEL